MQVYIWEVDIWFTMHVILPKSLSGGPHIGSKLLSTFQKNGRERKCTLGGILLQRPWWLYITYFYFKTKFTDLCPQCNMWLILITLNPHCFCTQLNSDSTLSNSDKIKNCLWTTAGVAQWVERLTAEPVEVAGLISKARPNILRV